MGIVAKSKNRPKKGLKRHKVVTPGNANAVIFALVFAVIGTVITLVIIKAAGPTASIEPENATITAPAVSCTDSNASGGSCVQFKKASTANNCSGTGAPAGYTSLSFCDDFTGTSLNLSKWTPNWLGSETTITPPSNDDMVNCEDPAQVSVSGGNLQLTLVTNTKGSSCRDRNGTATHASGLVNSQGSSSSPKYVFTHGYAEARMYMPGSSTQCYNWPGFWTDGRAINGVSWPVFLESDIMECLGDGEPAVNVHAGVGDVWKKSVGQISSIRSGWHTFAGKYEPGSISCSGSTPNAIKLTYYYDGQQVGSPYQVCYASTGQYLILQNDLGATHGGPAVVPSTVLVDYVRVWQ